MSFARLSVVIITLVMWDSQLLNNYTGQQQHETRVLEERAHSASLLGEPDHNGRGVLPPSADKAVLSLSPTKRHGRYSSTSLSC